MKGAFRFLFIGAFMLLALVSCSEKEEQEDGRSDETTYDDSYYASNASVSSSDTNYTASGNDGAIQFKTEGGQVTVSVSCGCGWIVENTASDLFPTSLSGTALTITATQNTVEEDLAGTITLKTESQRITFSTLTITQGAYGAPEITVETAEWNAPAVGALTTEIAVDATDDWTAESADEWLTVERAGTGIILTATGNDGTEERSTKVELSCADGIRTTYEYVAVTQDGLAYITLGRGSVTLVGGAGSAAVTVESNYDWTCGGCDDWLTVSRDGNVLTVSADANSGDLRTGTATLTAGDGAENVTEVQLTTTQAGAADMVLTYSISSANTRTWLPLSGDVSCTVYWGDGSDPEAVTSAQPTHTYATVGEYDVIISGTVTALSSSGISDETNPLPLTAVRQWGHIGLTSLMNAFRYCENLKSLPEYTGNALDNITSLYGAFYYCTVLEEIPKGLLDGCSLATDFRWMFSHCQTIKTVPQGLFDNCTSATNFRCVFQCCTALETVPSGLFNNCPEATDFYQGFYQCESLREIPSKMFGNSLEATDFGWCFFRCTSLKTIAADAFNCPKATDMSYILNNCTSLEEIPKGLFDNCPGVTNFEAVFSGNTALKTVPVGLFDNNSKVEKFGWVFSSCSSLTTIPEGLFANCPEATTFEDAFYGCSSLEAIPKNLFVNCSKVTTFRSLFYFDTKITEIPAGMFDDCPEVIDFTNLFYTTGVSSIPEGLFDNNTKVQFFTTIFYDCTKITEIPKNLFANCPDVTDFSFVFRGCTGITKIPENLFANCAEVTTFQASFYDNSINEIPANLFANNKKVENFASAFTSCTKITNGESPYDEIDGVKVHLYERANYPDVYTTPTNCMYCFTDCTGLNDYYSIPYDWGGGGASTSSVSGRMTRLTETSFTEEATVRAYEERPL